MKSSELFKYMAVLLSVGFFAVQSSLAQNKTGQEKNIRIAIQKNIDHFTVSIRGKYELCELKTSHCFEKGRNLRNQSVTVSTNGIKIGTRNYPYAQISIVSGKEIEVKTANLHKKYRERIDVVTVPDKRMILINTVSLEVYIRGVLYHEVTDRWPMEAMKAQAVAARTYAMFQMDNNSAQLFDVTGDIYSQVYGGRSAERYRTNLAVNRTKGEVMFFKGKVLPAYFHAACAGSTEDVSELWKQDLRPLKGVVCSFCKNSPHMYWRRNFRSQSVQEQLNKHGFKISGSILDIKVLERNKSNRIRNIQITTREGQKVKVPGKDFRQIIGPNIIKSNNFDIVMKGYYFDVVGKGWGHGVGMCQWGAQGMAKQLYSYQEILKHYYPGAEIININGKYRLSGL